MNKLCVLALAAAASTSLVAVAADNPFEAFRGKMKEGLYEYKMDMDMGAMPGLPPGMGKQSHTIQHCVTKEDMERGNVGRSDRDKPENCDVKDFKMSGNTATYKMVCKGRRGGDMVMDTRMSFKPDGFISDSTMSMNENGGGQPMKMKSHMEGRYLGACK